MQSSRHSPLLASLALALAAAWPALHVTSAQAAPVPSQEQQAPAQASTVDPMLLAALDQAAQAEKAVVSK